jgi:methyl-accepting chemotaxis protein
MIKVKITKLSDTSLRIERPSHIPGRAPLIQYFPARFGATSEETDEITVNTDKMPFTSITVLFNEIEINGTVPASVEDAITQLNSFIGNFNAAGGTALTTLQEMEESLQEMEESLQEVEESVQEMKESLQDVEEALTWN